MRPVNLNNMIEQKVIPALKSIKDVEHAIKYKAEYFILMDLPISQLKFCTDFLKKHHKKVIIHLDLIKGLTSDEHAVDYLIHELDVDGVISVKSSVTDKVKRLGKIAIQRMFLIDSQSYRKSIELLKHSKPDYIELLPGCLTKMIQRVKDELGIDVIAGGLIDTVEEVHEAINKGAKAITTSNYDIIRYFDYKY